MSEHKNYQLLLIEQASIPIAEELRNHALLDRNLRWRREEWTRTLTVSPLRDSVDLVIPLISGELDEAAQFFNWLDKHPLETPMLAVLPEATSKQALAATSGAVDDFVLWPFRSGEFDQRLLRILGSRESELDSIRCQLNAELGLSSLVGNDPAFTRTIENLPRIARNDGTVLITGETGTGKELCARAIHHLSPRHNFAFVPVDCGAFPEQLIENELFGHARGAFTDARTDYRGLASIAEGGTLFLDEIDTLPLASQVKLLRFLEDRVYKPLGSARFAKANIRVIAASNRDLEAAVGQKAFRADLYYRLNLFRVRIPPLRERGEDVAVLAQHFVGVLSKNSPEGRKMLSPAAVRRLMLHDWPGNVRELLNVIQRAIALTDGPQIPSAQILISLNRPASAEEPLRYQNARARAVETFERTYLEDILRRHEGNITRAAREAGKDRRALGRLVKKHRLSRPTET